MSNVPTAPPTLPRGALRIVLFGMPDAGKSSLLGALAEAADVQPHGLKARLVDPTHGLEGLRHHLYEGQPARTGEEVVPYPVVFEPFAAEGDSAGPPPVDVVLVDCDGQVANQFLSRQRSLGGGDDSPLRDAVLRADTLILVVDASAGSEVVRRDFTQFARFLRLLEQSRSQRAEVGGLPVYLVLTKCDLLVKNGDSLIAWMERIEEHKRVVDRKFQEYLAQQAGREAHPFGKVELHLWATAVKHPALESAPARPREPYGVAELFRQCLQSARGYRALQAHASRRLVGTVAALVGLVLLTVLVGGYWYATRPSPAANTLETEIAVFRSAQEEKPGARLREPLDDKIKQLQRFEADPAFAQVPARQREYVEGYLGELRAYQEYRQEVLAAARDPSEVRTEAELNRLLESLRRLAPPEPYAAAWRDTEVVRLRARRLEEAELLRREVTKAAEALKGLVSRWYRLQDEPLSAAQRKARERQLLNEADNLPYREEDRDRFLPGSKALTYGNVLQFDSVSEAYRQWRMIRQDQKGA